MYVSIYMTVSTNQRIKIQESYTIKDVSCGVKINQRTATQLIAIVVINI